MKIRVFCCMLMLMLCTTACAARSENSVETKQAVTTDIEVTGVIDDISDTVIVTDESIVDDTVFEGEILDNTVTINEEVKFGEIADYCVLTKEAVESAHPEIEGRTEEEVRDLLTVLTDDELKTLCPTDEDLDVFIQIARGREGNMFRDVTLDSIAKAVSDSSIYYNADCDIVFDFEGYEGVPVTVYYSKPKFLVYDWSLLVAEAFGYDAEQIKAFCESDDYEVIKTADVSKAREILIAHGGEPADWV